MSRRRIGHRYGRRHKELRRRFALRMARVEVFNCWRCGELITGQWDLGHVGDNTAPGGERWPEHRSCNRATMTNLKRQLEEAAEGGMARASREW